MDIRYSGLSRINHWFSVIFVVVMLTLGYMMFFANDRASGSYAEAAHIGVGFFAFWFLLWRTIYRLKMGFPAHKKQDRRHEFARVVHYLILLGLTLLIITGPLYLFTENEGLAVFDWFTVNLDLTALSIVHEPAEEVHKITGLYVLPVLLVVHIAGAVVTYLSDEGVARS
ncbi:MAG TPA: cytochrome B [Idiomarina loihiensis]|nr:cytochrome B [Idiomarina loihiensis]|tara:strand:- start:1893 stop:2402 length:510 start_codon:yes stop_codon:yes gene_type:complete